MALKVSHDVETTAMGGGILYVAPWTGSTPPEEADFYNIGNLENFTYNVGVTTVEHECTQGKFIVIDKRTVTKSGCSMKWVCDELTIKNLAMHALGTIDDHTIHAAQNADQEWAIRFVEDPVYGESRIFNCWRASVTPDGDVPWVSMEKYKSLGFGGAALADTANHPDSPLFDITVVEATV